MPRGMRRRRHLGYLFGRIRWSSDPGTGNSIQSELRPACRQERWMENEEEMSELLKTLPQRNGARCGALANRRSVGLLGGLRKNLGVTCVGTGASL